MNAERPDRAAELLDAATEGLAGDAELRLDVRAELATHIEEKREDLHAKGHADNEALDLALESFGPATDLAAELVEANRRRMKLRALVRLGVRAALVPVALAAALLVCGSLVLRGLRGNEATEALLEYGTFVPPGIPEEKMFLFTGDLSRPSRAERQRAIWERRPESKVYYGNYVTHLAARFSERFLIRDIEPTDAELASFVEEVGRGKKLDPGNPRYNYLLAGALIVKGCEEKHERKRGEDGEWRWDESVATRDRRLIDRATAELLEAGLKPRLKTYMREMATERLSVLPPARRYEDKVARVSVAAETLAFHVDGSFYRRIARTVPWLAKLLVSEGRPAEAERLLATWLPFMKQVVGEASFIDLLVAQAILGIVETKYAAAYEELGSHEEAERVRRWARRLAEPVKGHLEERKRSLGPGAGIDAGFKPPRKVEESGSTFANLMLSSAPKGEGYLAPGRYTEHVLLETLALSFMLALLLVLMFRAVVTALRWRWARGTASAPLLFLPSWKEAARILAFGVLLPLVAFYVYTRWSGLAGREYSFGYLFPRFVLELLLLLATIALLTTSMATRYVRGRCRTLGVPVPREAGRRRRLAHRIALGALWAACLALRGKEIAVWAAVVVGGPGSVVLLCYAVIAMIRRFRASREHGLFRGTVARSLIPVFAAAAILIGAIAHPYLTRLESALVQHDPILTLDEELLVSKPEADLVRRLRTEIREAILEIDSEIEAEDSELPRE